MYVCKLVDFTVQCEISTFILKVSILGKNLFVHIFQARDLRISNKNVCTTDSNKESILLSVTTRHPFPKI